MRSPFRDELLTEMDQQMQMDYLNARRAMDAAFQMMLGVVIIQQPSESEKAKPILSK